MGRKESFTIIEILVVVIIMAILAAIAIPIYQNSVARAEMNISAANLIAEFEKFKIGLMKSSYLYKPSNDLFCKNNSSKLKYIKGLLSYIFYIESVYAQQDDREKYSYIVNPALNGLTWDEITTSGDFDRAPIIIEKPSEGYLYLGSGYMDYNPNRQGFYNTNYFYLTYRLAYARNENWHKYNGVYWIMFIRSNGKVYIANSEARDTSIGNNPPGIGPEDKGVEEWTGRS